MKADHVTHSYQLVHVPLDIIHPNPYQLRCLNPAEVQRFAERIYQVGLQSPPQARAHPDLPNQYQLVFGHTRLAAYRLLRERYPDHPAYERMPLHKVTPSDRGMFEGMIAENVDRADLSPIDRAEAMKLHSEQFGATQVQTGLLFGVTQGTVSNTLRLLRLPQPVRDLIHSGQLTERAARLLIDLPDEDAIRIAIGAVRRREDIRSDVYVHQQLRALGRSKSRSERPTDSLDVAAVRRCPHCGQLLPIPTPRPVE